MLVVPGNAEIIIMANSYEAPTMRQAVRNMICIRSLNFHNNLENTVSIAILQMKKLRHGDNKLPTFLHCNNQPLLELFLNPGSASVGICKHW